ncbi:MAG: winged helix-turn-helix transcriptional regulator [Candidatus Lokiarchaeota archaeon]|nr:winged helix-turn-helix transcriptional regulator [Candidatus Lokiarchaeota archaeon]
MGECYLKEVLNLFGKKYTLKIIRLLLLNNTLRFNEILNEIGGSPKTITKRLRVLEDRGLIARKQFNEIPIRVEYSLTEAGKDLEEIFERISLWIKKWMRENNNSNSK